MSKVTHLVINWMINDGEDWSDYRGGVVKDNNTYLTDCESGYKNGVKNAKRFESVDEAIQFIRKWHNVSIQNLILSDEVLEEKGKYIIKYGNDDEGFLNEGRYVVRKYTPRNQT